MPAQELTLMLYNLTLVPVIFLSVLFLILSLVGLMVDARKKKSYPKLTELPFISVQVPTFNDPIAARCVEHCMKLDYPREKFEIMIIDDSTNVETQKLLQKYAIDNEGFVKFIHRDNRQGYKPGALKDAMPQTRGEIIVIFDADWTPQPDFLKKIIKPFANPNVAIVQSRQGYLNHETNLITRFAAYTLMAFHTLILPINDKINAVFFCGTAGAIRRSAMEKVGGWNIESLTEDADLTVRLLLAGYETVYLKFETPSEVPDTFESYIRQQMRWTYGGVRVFLDYKKEILLSKKLKLSQKIMLSFSTLIHFITPVIILMTIFGFVSWFIGDPKLMNLMDFADFILRFFYTAGFLIFGFFALAKLRRLREFPHLVKASFTLGLVLATSITYATYKAVRNQKLSWYCTPKVANNQKV